MKKAFNSYIGMTKRNIKVFFKDKLAVLLSMLTQIIVLALYLLFLKGIYLRAVTGGLEGLEGFISNADVEAVINSWLLSGVLGTSFVTSALSSLSVIVDDKQLRIDYDYTASPAKGSAVVLSYLSGAICTTVMTSGVLLTAGLVMLGLTGTFVYSAAQIVKMYGLVILGAVSSSLILMSIVSFFKKSSTLGAFNIMASTVIGFVVGAYIPVSEFGEVTQTAVNLVPGAQIAGMMRNALMKPAIDNIDSKLGGIDGGAFSREVSEIFVTNLKVFGKPMSFTAMMVYSMAVILIFIVTNILLYRFSSRRKG